MSDSFNQQRNHLNKQIQQQQHLTHKLFTDQQQRKRYSCDQCSYSTDRRDLYRRHENIHKDEKPFRCYICNKMFNRADHVKKHFLRIHKGLEYNVKLIKRSNAVDYSSPPTLDTNQNGENCSILSDGNLTVDKVDSNNNNLTSGSFNCLTNLPIKSERSFFNNYQTVFPRFTNSANSSQLQSHQRSLLTPLVKQHQQQSPTPSSQRSLLKQSNPPSSPPPPSRSLLTLLQQHPPPPSSSSSSPPSPPPSTFSPASSLLSSLTPSSPSAYNTNIDSDDDTTITTINHNNQIIIVICGKRNSNQKSIINHMLNSNGLKRCGKYSSSSSSIGLNTRKDKRKQNKPKRASIAAN